MIFNLSSFQVQTGINKIQNLMELNLKHVFRLHKVVAPLLLPVGKGLNDDLNNVEKPITIYSGANELSAEIPMSLAKWKRYMLKQLKIPMHQGLYALVQAIRVDEKLSPFHALHVDQYDWELHIAANEANYSVLVMLATKLYELICFIQKQITHYYGWNNQYGLLPSKLFVIDSQSLLDMYPNLSAADRVREITKLHQGVFITQIGGKLSNNVPHDLRAPDYDNWLLNGDLVVWHEPSDQALELSSMGVRVDAATLESQLNSLQLTNRKNLLFHQLLLNDLLPQSVGGGIGFSRLNMFLLRALHLGQVLPTVWDEKTLQECTEQNIHLL